MTHGSLFSGIGGFDLAASWLGWKNVFQCEKEPFCQKILKYHFPDCELFNDIKTTDFTRYANTIDIISGGFPCQPFSIAGKRKGTDDDRFLWDEMFRAICEISPHWVVAENVGGLLTQQSGVVFEQVYTDLEDAGYSVQPFIIPACAVNAPHRRDRVWIIAHAASIKNLGRSGKRILSTLTGIDAEGIVTDAENFGLQRRQQTGTKREMEMQSGRFYCPHNQFDRFPTQSPVCRGNDGLSSRLDGITFPKWRRKSIEAYGNAIVPQVAYQIFKVIDKIENL